MANEARRFPNLTPTSRSFSPGKYPQTMFEAQNGAVSVVRYASKPVNATLQLTFQNISDYDADSLIDHYHSVNDDWDYAFFPVNHPVLGGMDASSAVSSSGGDLERNLAGQPGGLRWRYTEPPRITSVFPNVSTVECSLTAYLDG